MSAGGGASDIGLDQAGCALVAAAVDPVALMNELPNALSSGALYLEYQPKFHLRQRRTTSLEALVRWRHGSLGVLPPMAFIEAAERQNHIVDLSLWTVRRALDDQDSLARNDHDLPIFINVSGAVLNNPVFVQETLCLLRGRTARLGFEITETAVIRDPDAAIDNLNLFVDAGIKIAIDDYGAGLSSLAYLKRLPAHELKIDKQFIIDLSSSHRDPLIVRSTIDLAHALEMEVTAEGIESEAALALLTVMGCDMGQGFLIQRPASLSKSIGFLREECKPDADIAAAPFRRLAEIWKAG